MPPARFSSAGWKQEEKIISRLLLCHFLQKPQGNGHVEIMSAGVHPVWVEGLEVQARLLHDRQTVNIRPPANRFLWSRACQIDQNPCLPSADLGKEQS